METKIGNTTQCRNLQGEEYDIFCNYNQNESDMESFKETFGLDSDITGLIGIMGDGDLEELWATTDSQPWNLTSYYERVK